MGKESFEEVWELAPYLSDKDLRTMLEPIKNIEIYVRAKDNEIIDRGETIVGNGIFSKREELNKDIVQIKRIKQILKLEENTINTIPDELKTPKAEEIKSKAVKYGLLNEDWTLTPLIKTGHLAALLAEYLSDAIGLTTDQFRPSQGKSIKLRKRKIFEDLWNCKYFAQTSNNTKLLETEIRGKEIIEACFRVK